MIGRVVSIKMKNTVVVLVESTATHPLYKKTYKQSKKYLADDKLSVKLGDIVQIEKIKPLSKRKHFAVVKVLGRDIAELVEEELKQEAAGVIEEVMPEVEEKNPEEKNDESEKEIEKPKKVKK